VHDEEGANEEEERLVAEAEAAAAEHTTDTFAIRRAAELFAGRPDLAAAYGRGWGQSKEWDRMCTTGEVDEVSPAAELPRCQLMWVLAVWRGCILRLISCQAGMRADHLLMQCWSIVSTVSVACSSVSATVHCICD
jgi:hypothetical protein